MKDKRPAASISLRHSNVALVTNADAKGKTEQGTAQNTKKLSALLERAMIYVT